MNTVDLGCRAVLAMVFGLALVSKVRERESWEAFVDTLPAFGYPARVDPRPAAIIVALAEGAAVALLGVRPWLGYLLGGGLLALFTVGMAVVLLRGERVACRCFGASQRPVGALHVLRNALLLAISLCGAVALTRASSESVTPDGLLLACVAGGLAGVFIVRWEDLAFLLGPPPGGPQHRMPPRR